MKIEIVIPFWFVVYSSRRLFVSQSGEFMFLARSEDKILFRIFIVVSKERKILFIFSFKFILCHFVNKISFNDLDVGSLYPHISHS